MGRTDVEMWDGLTHTSVYQVGYADSMDDLFQKKQPAALHQDEVGIVRQVTAPKPEGLGF